MSSKESDLSARQRELVARIYGGAANPASYPDLLRSWDAHFAALGEQDEAHHLSDFSWVDEWVEHFERAGEVFDKIASATQPPLEARVAAAPNVAFLIDKTGAITAQSAPTLTALSCKPGDLVETLSFDPDSLAALRALASAPAATGGESKLLRLYPENEDEPAIFLAEAIAGPDASDAAVLVRSANAAWQANAAEAIQVAFGLTPAEVDLVRELYLGRSIKEISERKGRSAATLRTQLSSVLGKIGVKGQAGLARVVSGLIHVLNQDSPLTATRLRDSSERLGALQRDYVLQGPGDISVHLVESGDLNGTPVFFIQTTTWPTLTPGIVEHLARRRLRVISPYRSGVEQTTRVPLSVSPEDWAQVYVTLLDQLGIGALCIGGQCSGGIYALALAQALGSRCRGVLLVDTGAPQRSARMLNQMPLAPRRLFLAARFFPLALRTPYKLARADFYSGPEGEARGVEYFVDDSPVDQERVKTPAIWSVVRDNFDYCMRNHEQAARDVSYWAKDTSKIFASALQVCPIRFLHGAENLVMRAGDIEEFVAANPRASAHFITGEAQLGIYADEAVLAEQLARLCNNELRTAIGN